MDRCMDVQMEGWNFPPVFYRTSSSIGSAVQKKLKTSVSQETLSAETNVFENAKFFSTKQIKNFNH